MPQPFDPRLAVAAGPSPADRTAAPAPVEPRVWTSLTFPFVTRLGRELSVTLALQPVFDLANGRLISFRVRRLVRNVGAEPALKSLGRRLESSDLRRLDLVTLQRGLATLKDANATSAVLPAYWRTVSTTHGRFALIYAGLQESFVPERLLIEVVGTPEITDRLALAETLSHFQTDRQSVILHIPPDAGLAESLVGAGCGCLAMDFAGVAYDGPRGWQEAERLIRAARRAAPALLILNIAPHWGASAAAAGATHAVFTAMQGVTA